MNTVTAVFDSEISAKTESLWQWDYGQILIVSGLDLPEVFAVHFTNKMYGETLTVLGRNGEVDIPDELLQIGRDIIAYIYLHTGENDGETEYKITIPVISRPQPSDTEPTPVQQDLITQAIAALTTGVERAEEAADEAEQAAANAKEYAERAEAALESITAALNALNN